MFSSKQKEVADGNAKVTSSNPSNSCVLDSGTVIEGVVRSTEDLRLDGKIIGDVFCEKRFVMGDSGKVEGTVSCGESLISGKIEGEIGVKGLLHLLNTAYIKGKIMASKMIVDEGANYSGECLIGENKASK